MQQLFAQSALFWSQVLFFAARRIWGLSDNFDAKFNINKLFLGFFYQEIMSMVPRTTSLFSSNEVTGSEKYSFHSLFKEVNWGKRSTYQVICLLVGTY
jgi:hypothetical protein